MSRLGLLGICFALACTATPDAIGGRRLRAVVLPAHLPGDSVGPVFPSLDATCGALAFASAGQVYLHDLRSRTFETVSVTERGAPGGRPSGLPALSADAGRIAFDSAARLLPRPGNRHDQIYVRDRLTRTTVLASISAAGDLANDANLGLNTGLSISADGALVAFSSYATNLVAHDENASVDVFVHGLDSGATERVSVGSLGEEAHGDSAFPSLSADGRFVAFSSTAEDLVAEDSNGFRDVFLHDRHRGTTERISVARGGGQPDGESDLPRISADSRFVVFASDASNLVRGDTNSARDVFLYDRESGATQKISAPFGRQVDGPSDHPRISDDGARVAFVSRSSSDAGEGASHQQVLLRDLREDRLWIVSASPGGIAGNDDSGDWGLALSGDGRCVAFTSFASNLVATKSPSLLVAEIPVRARPPPGNATRSIW